MNLALVAAARKGVTYGIRYLAQIADYHWEWELSAPEKVHLTLTYRCNCRCDMCDFWKVDDHLRELPADRWIQILEQLHDWIGTFRVTLNGGEVFLKPGAYDIARRAVDLGLTVEALSNGLIFKSDHHFRSLMDTGLRSITFSIDGKDAAIHDKHRGIPGIHATVSEVIRRIKRENPRMSISVICIIMRETAPHLKEFVRWAEDLGVDNVLFQPVRQAFGNPDQRVNWHEDSDLFVRDHDSLSRSIRDLIQLQAETNRIGLPARTLQRMQEYFAKPEQVQVKDRHCMLGQTDLRINPEGVVFMCDELNTTIGHVNEGCLKDIWRGERAREARRQIKQCLRPCAMLCDRSPGLREKVSVFLRYARAGRL